MWDLGLGIYIYMLYLYIISFQSYNMMISLAALSNKKLICCLYLVWPIRLEEKKHTPEIYFSLVIYLLEKTIKWNMLKVFNIIKNNVEGLIHFMSLPGLD